MISEHHHNKVASSQDQEKLAIKIYAPAPKLYITSLLQCIGIVEIIVSLCLIQQKNSNGLSDINFQIHHFFICQPAFHSSQCRA